jgi:hypothetical protein
MLETLAESLEAAPSHAVLSRNFESFTAVSLVRERTQPRVRIRISSHLLGIAVAKTTPRGCLTGTDPDTQAALPPALKGISLKRIQ